MTGSRYERIQNDLPWGWWLRSTKKGLEDGEGGIWPNVRTAFWEGRLQMPSTDHAGEQLELLLRVLTAIEAHWRLPAEANHDIFGGDYMFWRFCMCWLASIGMLDVPERGDPLSANLSDEGRAVMRMLQATRNPAWVDLPMGAVVEAVHKANLQGADEAREAALRSFEGGMTPLRHIFARERAGRAHLVTLTSIDLGERMPVRRVVWSISFLDESARDDLFGWLAGRVHRWSDWGGIARAKGAHGLTAHLLNLLVVSPVGHRALRDESESHS